jgi:hypothetical protein
MERYLEAQYNLLKAQGADPNPRDTYTDSSGRVIAVDLEHGFAFDTYRSGDELKGGADFYIQKGERKKIDRERGTAEKASEEGDVDVLNVSRQRVLGTTDEVNQRVDALTFGETGGFSTTELKRFGGRAGTAIRDIERSLKAGPEELVVELDSGVEASEVAELVNYLGQLHNIRIKLLLEMDTLRQWQQDAEDPDPDPEPPEWNDPFEGMEDAD